MYDRTMEAMTTVNITRKTLLFYYWGNFVHRLKTQPYVKFIWILFDTICRIKNLYLDEV